MNRLFFSRQPLFCLFCFFFATSETTRYRKRNAEGPSMGKKNKKKGKTAPTCSHTCVTDRGVWRGKKQERAGRVAAPLAESAQARTWFSSFSRQPQGRAHEKKKRGEKEVKRGKREKGRVVGGKKKGKNKSLRGHRLDAAVVVVGRRQRDAKGQNHGHRQRRRHARCLGQRSGRGDA